MSFHDDPSIDQSELAEANRRCDEELRRLGIDPRLPSGIRSGWKPQSLIRLGPLTDKRIAQYAKEGWFDADFKAARRERMHKRSTAAQLNRASGSFFQRDGRLIYSP